MSDSENAMTVDIEANRDSPTKTTVEAREFALTVDEPQEMGGSNDGPNPLEYLLAAQAGCLNVTGHQVASDMGIVLDDLGIDIDGEFDVATFQREQPDERTAVQNIDVSMAVETDADEETVEEWADRVEQRCPVSDNIKNETAVAVSVRNI